MTEISLIQIRRREVEQEINRYRLSIDALEKELAELELAARVIARLSGAERSTSGTADPSEAQAVHGAKPEGIPTIPDMILTVFTDEYKRGIISMEPKVVAYHVRRRWWPDLDGARVSSIMWRMEQKGRLKKLRDGTYALPEELEPDDDDHSNEASSGSLFNPSARP